MVRYLRRILKVLFVALFGFGGGVGLMTFIALVIYSDQHTALEMGIRSAVVIGLTFGTIIGTALVLSDLTMRLTVAGGSPKDELWELDQTRVMELAGTLKDIKQQARQALLTVPNLKSISEDEDESILRATTGKSWRSPGEMVRVEIAATSEGKFKVSCHSCCVQKQVGFDYAKNFENVETWLKHMEQAKNDP